MADRTTPQPPAAPPTWVPTPDEVRRIVEEMRPIIAADVARFHARLAAGH